MPDSNGLDKFREVGQKLKESAIATVQVQGIEVAQDIADFYRANASVGIENLSSGFPQLKITEANSKNELWDGTFATPGMFYYAPDKTQHDSLLVSVITISKGFYALDNSETPKPKFTQLLGGMLLDTRQPFIMFMSGSRLNNLWQFGKDIKQYTKSQNPVPMFAIETQLKPERQENKYGFNYVVKFSPMKAEGGAIGIITDLELLKQLRSGEELLKQNFESFIMDKAVDPDSGRRLTFKFDSEKPKTEEAEINLAEVNIEELPFA